MVDEAFLRRMGERIVGESRFTAQEVAATAGMTVEEAERLWTELGFPPLEPTERFFTAADVEVLATLRELQATGLVSPETTIAMTRVLGQALARVAMAQAQNIADVVRDGTDGEEEGEALDGILAMFEGFISYIWRRHLDAALRRQFDDRPTEVVGFADIVGYTRLTATMDPEALPDLVSRFQALANQHVTASGGRVLKVIGDAVMFVAPDPPSGAGAALGISQGAHDDPTLTEVRVGMATGPVVEIEGDLYGDTVNRASRLAELARPGTIVVDDETGTALLDGDVRVRPMQPRKLKGLGLVRSWVVRPPPS